MLVEKLTVFENHRKSRIQLCERSELRLHFEWTKINEKCQKLSIWATIKNLKCSQIVLPDRSLLIGQKRWKMSKFKYSNALFSVIFKHFATVIHDMFECRVIWGSKILSFIQSTTPNIFPEAPYHSISSVSRVVIEQSRRRNSSLPIN